MLAGWVIGLGLLGVWYSEHVKLNARIVELNGALIALALIAHTHTHAHTHSESERARQRMHY